MQPIKAVKKGKSLLLNQALSPEIHDTLIQLGYFNYQENPPWILCQVFLERSRKMSKTVLIVDDSASMRQLVTFTLKNAGFNVIDAIDGQDGLDKFSRIKIDLVITDLNMPVMDGIEMIRQIRSSGSQNFVPIVLLTTESQEKKKVEGKQAGATGWIVKPFKPEQLVAVAKKIAGLMKGCKES